MHNNTIQSKRYKTIKMR